MNEQKNLLSGILPLDDTPLAPVSINVIIPYLETYLSDTPSEHVRLIIGTALSVVFSRFTTPPSKKGGLFEGLKIVDESEANKAYTEFINEMDDYELGLVQTAVMGMVDYDEEVAKIDSSDINYDTGRMAREAEYEKVIGDLVELFNEYLITSPIENVETQTDIFLNCYESIGEIVIHSYGYYAETHRLWISIAG